MTRLLALSLILSCLAPASHAGLCATATTLSAFIAAHTSYPATAACPHVGRSAVTTGADAVFSQGGAYFPTTGRIEIAPDLDLATPYGQSYLLHEMVHAAQFRAGVHRTMRCPARLEEEAYRVQAAYLRAQGEMREAMLLSMLAAPLSRCPGDPPQDY